MTAPNYARPISPTAIGNLRTWLDLLAALRDFNQPINTPDGLRQAIAIVLELGAAVGIDPALLARFQAVVSDPAVFDIILAVDRYLSNLLSQPAPRGSNPTAGGSISIQSLTLGDWISLLAELAQLLDRWRAAR